MAQKPRFTFEWHEDELERAKKRRVVATLKRGYGQGGMATDLRELRAARIIDLSLQGIAQRDIGRVMGISDDTVTRELAWARKQGMVRGLEEQLLNGAIPEAVDLINDTIKDTDVKLTARLKAAEMALKLFGAFSQQSVQKDLQPNSTPDDPLDVYYRAMRARAIDVQTKSALALPQPHVESVSDPASADGAADPGHAPAAEAASDPASDGGPALQGEPAAGDPAEDRAAGGADLAPPVPE